MKLFIDGITVGGSTWINIVTQTPPENTTKSESENVKVNIQNKINKSSPEGNTWLLIGDVLIQVKQWAALRVYISDRPI